MNSTIQQQAFLVAVALNPTAFNGNEHIAAKLLAHDLDCCIQLKNTGQCYTTSYFQGFYCHVVPKKSRRGVFTLQKGSSPTGSSQWSKVIEANDLKPRLRPRLLRQIIVENKYRNNARDTQNALYLKKGNDMNTTLTLETKPLDNLAGFLRQCEEIKAGALDDLDEASLKVINDMIAGAHQHVWARKSALAEARCPSKKPTGTCRHCGSSDTSIHVTSLNNRYLNCHCCGSGSLQR